MANGHFGQFGPYADDYRLQQWHEERRKEEERQQRAERWLVDHLKGKTFHSFDALVFAATSTLETLRGPLDDESRRILTNACRAVWAGLAARAYCALEINERGLVESLTVRPAA